MLKQCVTASIVALTLLGMAAVSRAQTASPANGAAELSRPFRRAGLESIDAIQAWQDTLAYAIRNGYPVAGEWVSAYDERAAENLRLASVAATTSLDRATLQLLSNQFNNVQSWSGDLVEERLSMNAELAIAPDTINDDPLFQKISQCQRSLSSMLVRGIYENDQACQSEVRMTGE